MTVQLTAWHEQVQCTWCEKTKEGVTASFEDGFLQNASLCWSCLQKAVRVRARSEASAKPERGASESTN